MNMVLHNIGEMDGQSMVSPADALVGPAPTTYDYVLANPPFGKKSSMRAGFENLNSRLSGFSA